MRKAILPLAAGVAVCSLYLGAQEPAKAPPSSPNAAGDDDPFAEGATAPVTPKIIRVQVEYVELQGNRT